MQPEKAPSRISMTGLSMVSERMLVFIKAPSQIKVTELGMFTEVRLPQFQKA